MATRDDIILQKIRNLLIHDDIYSKGRQAWLTCHENEDFIVYYKPAPRKRTQIVYQGQDFSHALSVLSIYENK